VSYGHLSAQRGRRSISVAQTYRDRVAEPIKQALDRAEELAKQNGDQGVRAAHLFLAILERSPGVVTNLAPAVDPASKMAELRSALEASGGGDDGSLADALERALALATEEGRPVAELRHVVVALTSAEGITAAPGVAGAPSSEAGAVPSAAGGTRRLRPTPTLDKFGRDLTREASAGDLHPILGRDDEIDQVIQTLYRLDKPNALLVGPAGVGKTAIVEGVAQRIVSGDVRPYLEGARIVELQPSTLVAGTGLMGSLQERLKGILDELVAARGGPEHGGVILFIDEFHTAVGAGGPMGLQDVASQLKPALDRGEIACIGATTDREYEQHIRQDAALERRFDVVRVEELAPAHTLELLRNRRKKWEQAREVSVDDEALQEAVFLAGSLMRNRHFPDKAIDIVEQAVAYAYDQHNAVVDAHGIREIVARRVGQPLGTLERQLSAHLEEMRGFLRERVLGQDHVIDPVVEVMKPKLLGLDIDPERPNGVLFFTGPTGVGKTELAKTLAKFLYGTKKKLLRFDMSEFSEPHTVSSIKGAPPGYIGFDIGSPLLSKVTENPFSVLLLDEIEKAHPAVHQLFLQVFDAGVLTDSQGRHVYFSDVTIVMTANIQEFARRRIGFGAGVEREDPRVTLRRYFPPEFVNRIDHVALFQDLSPEIIRDILVERLIPEVQERMRRKGVDTIEIAPEAADLIAERGFDDESGAREMRRIVDTEVVSSIMTHLPEDPKGPKVRLRITVRDGELAAERAD
jgi:ATP-dependent Clp protease ATP-binding subunit ClpC